MFSILHISAHNAGNAGDIFLNESVQKLFNKVLGEIQWTIFDIQKLCTEKDIEFFNKYDAIVVGGGGHIAISSFYTKNETGWSVGLTNAVLHQLKPKLINYAIGYNLFRGEIMDNDVFICNMSNVIERSDFFSIRHYGDIGKLKNVVGDKDIRFNFCSSMVSYPFIPNNNNTVAFQFASDAVDKRFGSTANMDKFIRNMEGIAEHFSNKGVKVYLVSHTNRDEPIDFDIFNGWKDKGINCELISLVGSSPKKTADFYYGINTVFAMRGHSQMIPLGLGCKVVSLISHDKIRFLLEDLGIEDTGVEVNEPCFIDACLNAYDNVQRVDLNEKLEVVRLNISENMNVIKEILYRDS